jgi:hypothetical protein
MKKIVKTSHSLRIRQAEIRAKSFFFGDTLQILKTVLEHQTILELIHSRIMKIILYTARTVVSGCMRGKGIIRIWCIFLKIHS